MEQTFLNWLFGLMNVAIGFFLKFMWDSLRDLREADKELAEKVSKIEVLVAGEYVRHDDLDRLSDAIFKKLDRIEMKLDTKADR